MREYREDPPARELHPLVVCSWERRVPAGGSIRRRILPDGCVDLIWRDGEVLVAGPDTTAWTSEVPAGRTIVGLRLRPGVAGSVLGIPAAELRDRHPAAADVFPARWLESRRRLDGEATAEEVREELVRLLVMRLAEAEAPDSLVLAATRRLGFPGTRVSVLADALGISERQLRRRFHHSVGYGPKTLDRVLRFQRFALAARSGGLDGDLARAAADLGYADQAHLTRDCVRISGLAPTRLASIWAT
jgi:methylphosphotriester-DNA--protein-cysteine methyltransferase